MLLHIGKEQLHGIGKPFITVMDQLLPDLRFHIHHIKVHKRSLPYLFLGGKVRQVRDAVVFLQQPDDDIRSAHLKDGGDLNGTLGKLLIEHTPVATKCTPAASSFAITYSLR